MISVAIGNPTLLELIASTGVSAINKNSSAERMGGSAVFVTNEYLLNDHQPIAAKLSSPIHGVVPLSTAVWRSCRIT
jgi:hypothetical protein